MNKTISIRITDNETGDVVLKEDYNDFKQFRLVCFEDESINIYGKLPWRIMKPHLKKWAQVWVEAHPGEFETLVRQYRPETTDDEIINLIEDIENEVPRLIRTNGKRHLSVACHILKEMLKAVKITVRKTLTDIKTIWEFPQSTTDKTDSNNILGWLFRRRY